MSATTDIQISDDVRGAHSLHPVVKPAWFRCWNEKGYGYTARAYDAEGNRIGETHWSEPPYRKRNEAITALRQRLNAEVSEGGTRGSQIETAAQSRRSLH